MGQLWYQGYKVRYKQAAQYPEALHLGNGKTLGNMAIVGYVDKEKDDKFKYGFQLGNKLSMSRAWNY